jgi:S-phase kinase-associated protein 1
MEVRMSLLFDVVLAANYLDVKGLLDLGCKTIANFMKDKSPQEIKETFRIPDSETNSKMPIK